MKNLEIKVKIEDPEAIKKLAIQGGAVFSDAFSQADTYFYVSSGRLKVRDFCNNTGQLIGYERNESETGLRWSSWNACSFENPDDMIEILSSCLGVRGVVKKTRTLFLYKSARIHIDMVEGLGNFLEIESVSDRSDEEAQNTFNYLVDALDIDTSRQIHKSYIDLINRHES